MINDHFLISFNYPLAEDTFIFVKAEAMYNAANDVFLVGNFRSQRGELNLKLPPIEIKKLQGRWVHADSETPTFLSEHAGNAIDEVEQTSREVLEYFLEQAMRIDSADFGNIRLLSSSLSNLRIVAQKGFQHDFMERFSSLDISCSCPYCRMREEARPLLIPDLLHDTAFAAHRGMAFSSGVRSMVSVPVLSGGKFIGVLSVHSSEACRPWQVSGPESIAAEIGKYMQQHSIEG